MQRFFESEKRIRSGTVPLADGKKKYFDPIWNPSWFALSKYCEDASPIKDRKNANIVAFYESVKFFGRRLSPIVTSIDPTLLHCVLKIYFLSQISHFLHNCWLKGFVTLKFLILIQFLRDYFPFWKPEFFSVFRIKNLISFKSVNVRWHFILRRQCWISPNRQPTEMPIPSLVEYWEFLTATVRNENKTPWYRLSLHRKAC